jgi:hypothetical protein
MQVIGTPSSEEIAAVPSARARAFLISLPPQSPGSMENYFPAANPLAIDLMRKMLQFK